MLLSTTSRSKTASRVSESDNGKSGHRQYIGLLKFIFFPYIRLSLRLRCRCHSLQSYEDMVLLDLSVIQLLPRFHLIALRLCLQPFSKPKYPTAFNQLRHSIYHLQYHHPGHIQWKKKKSTFFSCF